MQRGDAPPKLPEAERVDVYDSPHLVDVDKMIAEVAKAPTVPPERRQQLQGKIVTGK
jgi:hypothetical protein